MRISALVLLSLLPFTFAKARPRRHTFSPDAMPATRAITRDAPASVGMAKRQATGPGQLLGLTACAELGANVQLGLAGDLLGLGQLLGLRVNEKICICVAGGVITRDSLARITAGLRDSTSVNLLLLGFLNVDAAAQAVANALVTVLGRPQYQDTCGFPANSIPDGCGVCTFTCAMGFNRCGNRCVRPGFCASGIPITGNTPARPNGKRSLLGAEMGADLLCPKGLSACGIIAPGKGGKVLLRGKHECLDTRSDVETCGGCMVPLLGQPLGIDCTAIPFVDAVSCISGKCVVQTCERGYRVLGGVCVRVHLESDLHDTVPVVSSVKLGRSSGRFGTAVE